MKYFRENKDATEYFTEENGMYTYMKPLIIKESCLKCHGKKEDILPIVKNNYNTALGYKLGDVSGVLSISVEEKETFALIDAEVIS